MEKFDKIMNWLADRMILLIILGIALYFIVNYWYPYNAGKYEFFKDYHYKHQVK